MGLNRLQPGVAEYTLEKHTVVHRKIVWIYDNVIILVLTWWIDATTLNRLSSNSDVWHDFKFRLFLSIYLPENGCGRSDVIGIYSIEPMAVDWSILFGSRNINLCMFLLGLVTVTEDHTLHIAGYDSPFGPSRDFFSLVRTSCWAVQIEKKTFKWWSNMLPHYGRAYLSRFERSHISELYYSSMKAYRNFMRTGCTIGVW